jgi:hypothetical protein
MPRTRVDDPAFTVPHEDTKRRQFAATAEAREAAATLDAAFDRSPRVPDPASDPRVVRWRRVKGVS